MVGGSSIGEATRTAKSHMISKLEIEQGTRKEMGVSRGMGKVLKFPPCIYTFVISF